jgi:predicted porin
MAVAETTVYGKIHLSAGRTTSEEATDKITSTQVKSHASRVGFKADKALDNGMTVVGQLEYEVDTVGDSTKSSADLIKARNSYFGLKGGFGEVRAGIHDLPSKMSTGSLDPFADTYADYNNVLMADDRGSNLLMYLNKFAGFEVAVAYSASKSNKDTPTVGADNVDAMNSLMLNYKTGPVFVSLSTVNYLNAAVGATESSPKAGVGLEFGMVKLGLVYEKDMLKDAKDDSAGYASLTWKVSDAGSLNAAYGKLNYGDATKKDKSFYAVGYTQKLDKSTGLYVLYTKGKDDGLATKASLHGDGSAAVVGATYSF